MNVEMAGQFTMHLLVSFVSGLIIVFPYILFEVWSFISPAMYKNEKRVSILVFLFSFFLFSIGSHTKVSIHFNEEVPPFNPLERASLKSSLI
mgnify:CR=1 FL=1